MKHTLLTTVAAICVGSAAFAGSPVMYPTEPVIYEPMEPVAVGTDWSGFYVGVLGGVQNGDLIIPPTFDVEETTYGAFAGYNFQNGNFVYGADVSAQMGNGTVSAGGGVAFDFDYLADFRGRVGYSMGQVLAYVAGGYTTGQVTDGFANTFTTSGWNAGAGAEFDLTNNFFVGGEYIYRNLSGTIPPDFDYNAHAGQLRAGFRF